MSENGVRGRVFGFISGKVTGNWRKGHKQKFYNLSSSLNSSTVIKTTKDKMGRALGTHRSVKEHTDIWWDKRI